MMAQFKSNFVAASSSTKSNVSSIARPALAGFVSGGLMGGDGYKSQAANPFVPASKREENRNENNNHKDSERLAFKRKF